MTNLSTMKRTFHGTVLERIVVVGLGGLPLTATIGNLPEAYPGGQVARGGRLGLLGNRDIMDTPFNTGSYTAQTIEDQGARTMADVMINDRSVRSTHSTGGILDSFYIGGFPINEGNFGEVAFDAVFGVAPTYRLFTDYAERIEVLKEPAALLYGIAPNSSLGGKINIVPERAGRGRSDTVYGRLCLEPAGRRASRCEPAFRRRASVRGPIQRQLSRRRNADRRPKPRRAGGHDLRRGLHRATERRSPRSSLAGLRPRFAANRMLQLMLMRRQHSDFLNGPEKSKDNSLSL